MPSADIWPVFSVGNTELLAQAFNAVAAISNEGGINDLIRVGLMGGLFFTVVRAVVTQAPMALQHFLASYMAIMLMFSPTATVEVNDSYDGSVVLVDNVPLGVAAPFSIVTQGARMITEMFETAYGNVDTASAMSSGGGYGDSLHILLSLRDLKLGVASQGWGGGPKADLGESLQNFFVDCVMYEMVSPEPLITSQSLENTPDLWNHLAEASFVNIDTTFIGAGGPQQLTCRDAYLAIGYLINDASVFTEDMPVGTYLLNLMGKKKNSDGYFAKPPLEELQEAMESLALSTETAQNYMVMTVLNSMYRSGQMKHAIANNAAAASALVTAEQQRNLQWANDQTLFERVMRDFMAFLEMFVVAITPIMAFLMGLGPMGISLGTKYLLTVAWYSLWLPVLSLCHFYIEFHARNGIKLLNQASQNDSLTLVKLDAIVEQLSQQAAVGGVLAAAVPSLTLFLIYGGAVTATALAGRMKGGDFYNESTVAPPAVENSPVMKNGPAFNNTPGQNGTQANAYTAQTGSAIPSLEKSSGASTEYGVQKSLEQAAENSQAETFGKGAKKALTAGTRRSMTNTLATAFRNEDGKLDEQTRQDIEALTSTASVGSEKKKLTSADATAGGGADTSSVGGFKGSLDVKGKSGNHAALTESEKDEASKRQQIGLTQAVKRLQAKADTKEKRDALENTMGATLENDDAEKFEKATKARKAASARATKAESVKNGTSVGQKIQAPEIALEMHKDGNDAALLAANDAQGPIEAAQTLAAGYKALGRGGRGGRGNSGSDTEALVAAILTNKGSPSFQAQGADLIAGSTGMRPPSSSGMPSSAGFDAAHSGAMTEGAAVSAHVESTAPAPGAVSGAVNSGIAATSASFSPRPGSPTQTTPSPSSSPAKAPAGGATGAPAKSSPGAFSGIAAVLSGTPPAASNGSSPATVKGPSPVVPAASANAAPESAPASSGGDVSPSGSDGSAAGESPGSSGQDAVAGGTGAQYMSNLAAQMRASNPSVMMPTRAERVAAVAPFMAAAAAAGLVRKAQTSPAGAPAGGSAGAPAGGSAGAPAGGSAGAPAGGSAGAPAGGSAGAPAGGSTGAPAGGSTGAPAGGSTEAPAGGSTEAPAGGSTDGDPGVTEVEDVVVKPAAAGAPAASSGAAGQKGAPRVNRKTKVVEGPAKGNTGKAAATAAAKAGLGGAQAATVGTVTQAAADAGASPAGVAAAAAGAVASVGGSAGQASAAATAVAPGSSAAAAGAAAASAPGATAASVAQAVGGASGGGASGGGASGGGAPGGGAPGGGAPGGGAPGGGAPSSNPVVTGPDGASQPRGGWTIPAPSFGGAGGTQAGLAGLKDKAGFSGATAKQAATYESNANNVGQGIGEHAMTALSSTGTGLADFVKSHPMVALGVAAGAIGGNMASTFINRFAKGKVDGYFKKGAGKSEINDALKEAGISPETKKTFEEKLAAASENGRKKITAEKANELWNSMDQ